MAAATFRVAQAPGTRERVDVNILDTLLWLNWKSVLSATWHRPPPRRQGRLSSAEIHELQAAGAVGGMSEGK